MKIVHPELEQLANEYIKMQCEVFPFLATYYGFTERYSTLHYPTKEQLQSFIEFLENLLQKVTSISGKMDELDKIDQEVLQFIINLRIFELQVFSYEKLNLSPPQLILRTAYNILSIPRLSNKEKLEYVLANLRQGLDLFDSLRQTWEEPTLLALEDTFPQAQNLQKILMLLLKPLIDSFPDEKSIIEDLVVTISEKGRKFAHWLETEIKPRTTVTCHVLGRENYIKLLEMRKEGHNWSERLKIGENSLNGSKDRLIDLAKQITLGEGTIKAGLAKVRADQPKIPILEEAKNAHQHVSRFLKDKGLLQVPTAQFEIIEPPSWDPFWGEGMMGASTAELLTESPVLKIIIAPPQTEKGKQELNRSYILLGVAHEGDAGHLSSYLLIKERKNIIKLLAPTRTGIDDRWTFYWEELLREEGICPTLEYAFYQEYRTFWCSLRQICDVKLHCGLMSFEECAQFLEEQGEVPPIMAKVYAKIILQAPGYFSSFIIGKQQLIKLREQVKEQLGEKFALELFHKWVGEAGPIPYAFLKREIQERTKEVK
ncbi:MAG: DUF885 family protein [Candidatus Hermodarchaeota archaeon]